ncbi:hypothetical protein Adt_23071 [Abeliophyllum distichum]|uniref:Uncharacterized protein n=1 Tax=Abeliophyllum distichum TaxID=126358 RepID=A0ABD1SAM2_9LAMI
MVVIYLLLCRMPPCLANASPDVSGDSFKSTVSATVFYFQSHILTSFVIEFFNLDFEEIQKCDGDGLLRCSMLSSSPINDGGGRSTVGSNFEISGPSVSTTFLSTNGRMMVYAPQTIFIHSSTIHLCAVWNQYLDITGGVKFLKSFKVASDTAS